MKKRGLFLDRASAILALFWFLCFVVSLAIPGLLLLKGAIEQPSFMTALDQTSSLYAPYLGAILAYYFAKRKSSHGLARRVPFGVALGVSALWNIVVCGVMLQVPLGLMPIEDALKTAGGAGSKLAWLVAPSIGCFLAKPGE